MAETGTQKPIRRFVAAVVQAFEDPSGQRRARDEHRRLRELAEWLVSREQVWVDPQRTVERQTLTLQQIIDPARQALAGEES